MSRRAAQWASVVALSIMVLAALAACAAPTRSLTPPTSAQFTHSFELQATVLGGPKRATVEATSEEDCKRIHRAIWSALRDSGAELSACVPK